MKKFTYYTNKMANPNAPGGFLANPDFNDGNTSWFSTNANFTASLGVLRATNSSAGYYQLSSSFAAPVTGGRYLLYVYIKSIGGGSLLASFISNNVTLASQTISTVGLSILDMYYPGGSDSFGIYLNATNLNAEIQYVQLSRMLGDEVAPAGSYLQETSTYIRQNFDQYRRIVNPDNVAVSPWTREAYFMYDDGYGAYSTPGNEIAGYRLKFYGTSLTIRGIKLPGGGDLAITDRKSVV